LISEFEGIDQMWKEKKKHKLAEHLGSTLVTNDLSWQVSKNKYNRTILITMPHDPINVVKRKRVSVRKREERRKKTEERPERPERTALFLATKNGIVEIVNKFLQVHPAAIYHVTEKQHNILTM